MAKFEIYVRGFTCVIVEAKSRGAARYGTYLRWKEAGLPGNLFDFCRQSHVWRDPDDTPLTCISFKPAPNARTLAPPLVGA